MKPLEIIKALDDLGIDLTTKLLNAIYCDRGTISEGLSLFISESQGACSTNVSCKGSLRDGTTNMPSKRYLSCKTRPLSLRSIPCKPQGVYSIKCILRSLHIKEVLGFLPIVRSGVRGVLEFVRGRSLPKLNKTPKLTKTHPENSSKLSNIQRNSKIHRNSPKLTETLHKSPPKVTQTHRISGTVCMSFYRNSPNSPRQSESYSWLPAVVECIIGLGTL
ncbi:hypothetical protein PoB_005562900 [Plakobranchus ocellatus]|uniref:Uncharacterized protein n=1 Tax=Plakobranchus ocellatus TaxID=259542 RepID=A0AAV4CDC0_9GAST|nr:hypothetical protein PoB_005562900 [Plakobranchus ocellatus]